MLFRPWLSGGSGPTRDSLGRGPGSDIRAPGPARGSAESRALIRVIASSVRHRVRVLASRVDGTTAALPFVAARNLEGDVLPGRPAGCPLWTGRGAQAGLLRPLASSPANRGAGRARAADTGGDPGRHGRDFLTHSSHQNVCTRTGHQP